MVHTTEDYTRFEFNELNRGVDAAHVRKLKKNIKDIGLVQPITVDSDGHIIDGQHRFHACRELGIPVRYIIQDSMNMEDVVALNNMSKPWSTMDKVQSFAAQGNEHYQKLLDFYQDCKDLDNRISIRVAILIAQGRASHASSNQKKMNIGKGTWEFREDYEVALKRLYSLLQFKRWDFYLKQSFVTAFLRCLRTIDGFDPSELLKRAETHSHMFVYAGTTEETLRVFENVYNYRRKGNNHKRFF